MHTLKWLLLLVVVGWSTASDCLARDVTTPFRIDDIFQLESLSGPYSFSADGNLMAFVLKRAINTDVGHHYIFANDRSDVWIYDQARQTARNLTNGVVDRTDFWYPVWSPRGDKLAMISTRNAPRGYNHVWIWDRSSGTLSQLSGAFADIENDPMIHARPYNLVWLSDSVIAFPTLSESVRPAEARTNRQAIYRLTEQWATKIKGVEPTAVILESGRKIDKKELAKGEKYIACNAHTTECHNILDLYLRPVGYDRWGGNVVVPSPKNGVIAVLGIDAVLPANPNRQMHRMNTNRYQMQLLNRKGELVFKALEDIKDVVPGSIHWSLDGSHLAFVASSDQRFENIGTEQWDDTSTQTAFVLNLETGRLQNVSVGDLDLVAKRRWYFHHRYRMVWTRDNSLIIHAKNPKSSDSTQTGWWLINDQGRPINVTAKLGFVPEELYPVLDGSSLLCAGNGNLWLLSLDGNVRRLTNHSDRNAIAIIWKDADIVSGGLVNELVYRSGNGASEVLKHFDLRSKTSHAIPLPSAEAEFMNVSAASRATVFVENNRLGTRVWLGSVNKTPTVVHETNTFLEHIAEGEARPFEYTSLDGDSLAGWLLLPVNYERDKRYPLVTWVYQGRVMDVNRRPGLSTIAILNPLNLQTLASNGYAVLFPSMPGRNKEYSRLLSGVMPAVDKVIEMGIADPERLAVMGQSNGGFSTYGLITLTNRFKAAVAIAGMTDLFSISLQFPPRPDDRERIEHGVTGARFTSLESDFGLPWRSVAPLRNSPISYVDRVQTPILQLHGDFDGVPIQQAEEFFTALQRLGKRAKFVRYLGDDHVFQSPANVKHSWEQILNWLDEFLGRKE